MSTTLFARQWTLQKSGLRLPFICWSANFANSFCFLTQLSVQLNSHFGHFVLWCTTSSRSEQIFATAQKTMRENLLRFWYPPNYPWPPHHWANKGPTWSSFNCNESLSEWKAHFIGGPKSQTAITSLSARQKNKMHFLNFKWDLNELEVSESTNHLR